ncbi:MAG: carboxypeptidase-like regulatory domain-containing protein [Pyrinomonadaceae bacterium]
MVFDVQGNRAPLSATFPNFITIGTTTTVSGVVRRPSGQALANTTVQLRGTGTTRFTAVTSSFGSFTFPSVPLGRSYTLNVVSKRFRFPATPIFVSNATDVELKGLE